MENKFTRCEADDPGRCQSILKGGQGQCPYKAVEGFKFCPLHHGRELSAEKKNRVNNYRLDKYQARVNEFADNDAVKSLREEIGIMRMLLEEIVNQCHSTTDLILFQPKISDLVMRVEKLVVSCQRLETANHMLLDKTAVIHLANIVVQIIGTHIPNEDTVGAIGTQIVEEILKLQHAPAS